MRVLDQGVVLEPRHPRAEAGRPVGTPVARSRSPGPRRPTRSGAAVTTTVAIARVRNARLMGVGRIIGADGCRASRAAILAPMSRDGGRADLRDRPVVAQRVDDVLDGFLAARREEAVALDPRRDRAGRRDRRACSPPAASGSGRPSATGGSAPPAAPMATPIWRAAAALELLHTMALIHDDVMDGERRAARAARDRTSRPAAAAAARPARPRAGRDRRSRSSPATSPPCSPSSCSLDVRVPARTGWRSRRDRFHRMRIELAAGRLPRPRGRGATPAARRSRTSRAGAYTVEGPLLIGAALAGSTPAVDAALVRYGAPLGQRVPAARRPRRRRRRRPAPRAPTRSRSSAGGGRARPPVARVRPPPTPLAAARRPRGIAVTEDVDVVRRMFRDVPSCRIATVRPDGGPARRAAVVRLARGRDLGGDAGGRHHVGGRAARPARESS